VAYLVLSHRHPERVEALAERIHELSPRGEVVVHHDASGSGLPWAGTPPERAHLIPSMPVQWGDWSVVEATLRLLRYARDQLDAAWLVLLSGDDRPVVDLGAWERKICSTGVDGIVCARPLTKRPVLGRRPTADDLNFARYTYRWRPMPSFDNAGLRTGIEVARRLSRFVQPLFKIEYAPRRARAFLGVPRAKTLPGELTVYTGPQWMALGSRAADAILDADPQIVAWFKETWIPDQAFFHTVLHNDPILRICNERLTYVVPQSKAKSRSNWMVLRSGDLDEIKQSGSAFARKFDPSVDPTVAILVDDAITESLGSR